jgi:hypothetical protein
MSMDGIDCATALRVQEQNEQNQQCRVETRHLVGMDKAKQPKERSSQQQRILKYTRDKRRGRSPHHNTSSPPVVLSMPIEQRPLWVVLPTSGARHNRHP